MLAKIHNNVVEKVPYTMDDLVLENPYTQYDSMDVETIFPTTEEATNRGAKLVAAVVKEKPKYNDLTHKLVQTEFVYDPNTDQAVSDWTLVSLTQEESAVISAENLEKSRQQKKVKKEQAVKNIKVTTQSGKIFDGDELSQNRIIRAINALQITGMNNTPWVLADNTTVPVSLDELKEALKLAVEEHNRIWLS